VIKTKKNFLYVMLMASVSLGMTGCATLSRPPPPEGPVIAGEEPPGRVVDPDIKTAPVKVRGIPAEDFEVTGTATFVVMDHVENDKTNFVGTYSLRGAYHVTEDFFVEAGYGKASRTGWNRLRRWLNKDQAPPIGLETYDISAGVNLFPGDLYLGKNFVLPFVGYATAGLGYLKYEGLRAPSGTVGIGVKFFPKDWLSFRYEIRDRMWLHDGDHSNAEFTVGVGVYF
jgi:outer membrane beta-barrel protein